ncbi:MAG: 1-acyl-sn-glycerol-3-phosphate acyltransferase [Clostridia bacterium]|nr:1-acyl-sn-glycerol-3-phosphate acyltransferase [Clostridia bacterium]
MKKMFLMIGKGIDATVKFILATILLVVAFLLYIPFRIIFPTKIVGRKNLRKVKGGKIVASNHFSNFDGVLLVVYFYPITYVRKFLAKVELAKKKFFAYVLRAFGAIFIDRTRLDVKAMREATKELQKGKTLIMFPEGTRNKQGSEDTKALKGGVIYFANKADATIVPVTILHRPKPFRFNKIIVSEGYKIDKSEKCNTEKEIEKLENIYKEVRAQYTNKEKGE